MIADECDLGRRFLCHLEDYFEVLRVEWIPARHTAPHFLTDTCPHTAGHLSLGAKGQGSGNIRSSLA